MKCFYHPLVDAVAICKSCNKGICPDCAVDVTNGMACADQCEAEVRAINDYFQRGKTVYQKAGRTYYGMAIIFGLMSLTLVLMRLLTWDRGTGIVPLVVGAIFGFGALFLFSVARKYLSRD